MTPELVTGLSKDTLRITLLLAVPLLGTGLIVGLTVSIFQAVTQIQELTLTFVPKILAVLLVLVLLFPWMMQIMLHFTSNLFMNIPGYIR